MGISLITALEIFTNPGDLEIKIMQTKGDGKFSIGILRGPDHNFKPLLTSQPFAEKLEDAIEAIREILEGIKQTVEKDLSDSKTLSSQYVNPDGLEVDQLRVLNPKIIARILDELLIHQSVGTYKQSFQKSLD